MDQAIIAFTRKEYSLLLGERTAEEIKMAIGSACPSPQEPRLEIRGRDLVSGLPKTVVLSGAQVRHAIAEPVTSLAGPPGQRQAGGAEDRPPRGSDGVRLTPPPKPQAFTGLGPAPGAATGEAGAGVSRSA